MKKKSIRQILTTLAVLCAISLNTGCKTINKHMFEQADKDSTGVLCVGMETSRYGACPGAQVDATRMHKLLKKYSDHTTLLISQQATKAVVVQKMVEVCQKDLAIIFYSGHGGDQRQSATTKLNWPEPTGKDQFLCLYDAPMIDDEIWNVVCGAKGRVVLIFDCCHSGTMFREPLTLAGKKVDEGLFGAGKEPRMLCISGCEDTAYSYGDANGGLLTNAILKHFKEDQTYNKLWRLLNFDKALYQQEHVQFHETGESFKDFLIFR